MKVQLRKWSKPLSATKEKVCSLKLVCDGKPKPDTREHFYDNQSGCIACMAEVAKRKWAEKKKDNDLFFGN